MSSLKEFTILHGKEMAEYTANSISLSDIGGGDMFTDSAPAFGETMWAELARSVRGLSLSYCDFQEFWDDFKPWWETRVLEFARIFVTAALKYDRLSNYDRNETTTEKNTRNASLTEKNEVSNSNSFKDSQTVENDSNSTEEYDDENKSSNKETAIERVNGYNSFDDVLSTKGATEKDTENGSNISGNRIATAENNSTSSRDAKSASMGYGKVVRNDGEHGETVRTSRISGNVGVTTSQQMLTEERRLMADHVVGYIADEFKASFCIMVY